MKRIRRIRHVATALAGLALTWLGLAVAAPAAFAATSVIPSDDGSGGAPADAGTGTVTHTGLPGWQIAHHGGAPAGPGAGTVTRTVVLGGMPGWQIALIAVGAALVAAALAVLADRTRTAHRKTAFSAA